MRVVLTALVVVATVLGQVGAAQAQSSDRPNVVLIITDDVGLRGHRELRSARHQDAQYRQPGEERHAADRFLRGAELLTHACGAHQRPLSAAHTGSRYRSARRERPAGEQGLRATGRSLPQLLKNNGYRTALIGKWHLGYKQEFSPVAHGFDYFFGFKSGLIDYYQHTDQTGRARSLRER